MEALCDHYAVLGVPRDAGADTVKEAYRRLALEHHPDKANDDAKAQAFAAVQLAWEALRDPQRRADYDAALQAADAAARSAAAFTHSQHVSATIGDDDLDWDDDAGGGGGGGGGRPFFRCRCGDKIYVDGGDGTATVCCPSCSLRYRLAMEPHR